MKYPDLVRSVQKHNRNWVCESFPEDKGVWSEDESSIKIHGAVHIADCSNSLCGFTKTADDVTQLVEKWLTLTDRNKQECRVAVASVVDKGTRDSMDDLPAVLAVGINYGQGDWYADHAVPLEDNTQLRSQASKVLQELKQRSCCLDEMASFHLVAANFFPWITQWTWGDLNSIEESILLRGSGHPDSVGHVVGLIQKIRPQVVMFHGANNAAPGLGWHVMDRLCGPSWNRADCKFVFSDNLAPPNRAISNAVMTPCPVGRHNLPPGFEA